MIVGDVGCLHAYIRRLLHIGAERSAIKPVANKNKKAKTFRFSLFVPLEVLFSNELLTDLGRIWALRYIIADPKVVEYNYYIKRS